MLALFLATSLAVAQSTTHCESVKAELPLVFDSWAKSGGAMPGPGTLMAHEGWVLGEDVLGRIEWPYLDVARALGDVDWVWVEGSRRGKKADTQSMQETSEYTIEVTLTHRAGEPIHALIPESSLTLRVRCASLQVWGIP